MSTNWTTVKPLLRVVLSVFAPWLTGVAKLLVIGLIEFNAVFARKLRCRLSARCREAMSGGTIDMEGERERTWMARFQVLRQCSEVGMQSSLPET